MDSGTCLIQSRAGGLTISTHIVHPGGTFSVTFSPVHGFDDSEFDITEMGLPGVPRGREGCEELNTSCLFQVPTDVVPDNTYMIYTLGFGTVQGPARSNVYLAVVGQHTLTGEVDDTRGRGIYGATVSVEGPRGEMIVKTDQGGAWGLNLPGGAYNVKVASTPGADQLSKVSQCSGHVSGRQCIVDLSSGDGTANFVEGGVTVTDVTGPGGVSAVGPTVGGTTITITGSGLGMPVHTMKSISSPPTGLRRSLSPMRWWRVTPVSGQSPLLYQTATLWARMSLLLMFRLPPTG